MSDLKSKIDLQKSVADTVLSKLELLDRYCIVAGGAPRDWYLGNLASDIDVYLHYPINTTAKQRISLLKHLGFVIDNSHENWLKSELYESNHNILYLYNCTILKEKVQIIFVDKPTFTSVVDTFPISISKVWYKRGIIHTTEDFEMSIKYKVLWKTINSYPETNKYLLKIKNKFNDYKYINKEDLSLYKKSHRLHQEFKKVFENISDSDLKIIKENIQYWLDTFI